jgi:putative flippase GtrA
MIRWWRFNAVGAGGFVVQVLLLDLALRAGLAYLTATALAVEGAILHNYVWHRRWTWRDRPQASLLRFHLTAGLLSLAGNLLLMRLLVGAAHLPPAAANPIAVGLCALGNFLLADRAVFLHPGATGRCWYNPRTVKETDPT